jgi:hypothetical protein
VVHTIFGGTLAKKILLSLVLFFVYELSLAYDYGFGVLQLYEKNKNDTVIRTNEWYDQPSGRILGERYIYSRHGKNITETTVPFLFLSGRMFKLSVSTKFQDIRIFKKKRWYYFGAGLHQIKYKRVFNVSEIDAQMDCNVSCSYISKPRKATFRKYLESEDVEVLQGIAYFGLKYDRYYLDLDTRANIRIYADLSF